jgi:hypothetical protein
MYKVNFCEVCGNVPAENVLLQSASSRLIWWNHRKVQALLCGICAERVYYDMQSRNLIQGWWGVLSGLATVWFSITNIVRIRKHRMVVPVIQADGREYSRIHMNVRNNLVAVIITGLVLFGAGYLALSVANDGGSSFSSEIVVGTCFSENSENILNTVSCDSSDAKWEVTGIIANKYYCPLNEYTSVGDNFACLKPVY